MDYTAYQEKQKKAEETWDIAEGLHESMKSMRIGNPARREHYNQNTGGLLPDQWAGLIEPTENASKGMEGYVSSIDMVIRV